MHVKSRSSINILASITIWNSGSINREFNPEFSSGKRPFSDLYDFENSKCCALCPMPGNSFSCHKLWDTRDKLWIILTIPLKFVTLASVWKIKSTNTGIPVLFIYFYVYFVFVMYIFVYFMLRMHVILFGMWVCRLYVRCVLLLRERDRARYLN